jgi:hypothetical protein
MQTNQENSIKFQFLPHADTVSTWITRKLDALRQKRIAKRDAAYLRTMDHHMLKDMGIDISALGEIYPSLERSRSSLKYETSGFLRLPVNVSTR